MVEEDEGFGEELLAIRTAVRPPRATMGTGWGARHVAVFGGLGGSGHEGLPHEVGQPIVSVLWGRQ